MSTPPTSAAAENTMTIEDYLVLDRQSEQRHEYLEGKIFAMSGGSPWHAQIIANLGAELRTALRDRPCWVFVSDLRLRVDASGLYTYPDVTVACGELRFADEQADTLVDPTLVVEVLSPSTADYDRGSKFAHYRQIPTLGDYLVVAQDRAHAELWSRSDSGRWLLTDIDGLDGKIELPSLEVTLEMSEIFHKVTPVTG